MDWCTGAVTGAITVMMPPTTNRHFGGFAWFGGELYLTATLVDPNDFIYNKLVTLDPATGAVHTKGTFTGTASDSGSIDELLVIDGALVGFNYAGGTAHGYTIDPETAATTPLIEVTGSFAAMTQGATADHVFAMGFFQPTNLNRHLVDIKISTGEVTDIGFTTDSFIGSLAYVPACP